MIRKFCLTLAVIYTASFYTASAQQTAKVTASGIGYLQYLPKGYNSNANKYPIVISLHGIKEKGPSSTDPKLVLAGLASVDNVGLPSYVKKGKQYPFILISPQLKSKFGMWTASYVMEVLNYVKKRLRIDERRIYLTGLSLGGFGVWRTAAEHPTVFAAIVPVCSGGNALSKAGYIASKNLPVWGFHGGSDRVVSYTVTTKMVAAMNSAAKKPNPLAKATIFSGMGHNIWDKTYNQTNALNWMLSHRKGSVPSSSVAHVEDSEPSNNESTSSRNSIPVASAGPDRVITMPTNSLYIQGRASDKDGKIVSYQWTKTYGKRANLGGYKTPRVHIYNLQPGIYIFRLTVRDNEGGIKHDYFKITVKAPARKISSNYRNDLPAGSALRLADAVADRRLRLSESVVRLEA